MPDNAIQLLLNEWLLAVFNPQKRIFWGYLLSSLFIAILWLRLIQKINIQSSFIKIFNRNVWGSASAFADYKVMFINAFLMTILSPRILAKATVAYIVFNSLHLLFEGRPSILTGISMETGDKRDIVRSHRFTVFRTHPAEAILFSVRSALVQGISTAVFFFFFGNQVTLVMVLGASIFTFAFNLLGSNLRHSPVSISYWHPIELILMSPAQHHIHHSTAEEHIDRNFGVALSVWDWIFGTLCHSKVGEQLNFGLSGTKLINQNTLKSLYLDPIQEAGSLFIKFTHQLSLPFQRENSA